RSGLSFIGALLHRRQIFDWKHHALVLISYVKNLRNRRSLLVPLRGFTLAEVLITLGIIGVVAALTIPTLMQKTNDKEIVTGLKKNVKVFQDAIDMAVLENGKLSDWNLVPDDIESANKVVEYLSPHLKFSTICENSECDAYPIKQFNVLKGEVYPLSNLPFNELPRLVLTDGSVATIRPGTDSIAIYIDLNGKKGPNTLGRDIFHIGYIGDGKFNGGGVGTDPSTSEWASCNPTSGEGWHCTGWVLYKENLDYLHCADELSWNGKTKCD
ncbi:type II secretion system protein, partial [bacterium]|nr:type II secretion system protein [bacterium]